MQLQSNSVKLIIEPECGKLGNTQWLLIFWFFNNSLMGNGWFLMAQKLAMDGTIFKYYNT
jgi:hypothetical protein